MVNWSKLETLTKTFDEAILVEKDRNSLIVNLANKLDNPSTFKKYTENLGKNIQEKKETDSFDMEILQRLITKLTNEVVDIKKKNNENNQNRGYFWPPFRINFQNKPSIPPPKGLNVDEVANVLKSLMSHLDKMEDQQSEVCLDDIAQQEVKMILLMIL